MNLMINKSIGILHIIIDSGRTPSNIYRGNNIICCYFWSLDLRKIDGIYWSCHIFHLLNFGRIFGKSYLFLG